MQYNDLRLVLVGAFAVSLLMFIYWFASRLTGSSVRVVNATLVLAAMGLLACPALYEISGVGVAYLTPWHVPAILSLAAVHGTCAMTLWLALRNRPVHPLLLKSALVIMTLLTTMLAASGALRLSHWIRVVWIAAMLDY